MTNPSETADVACSCYGCTIARRRLGLGLVPPDRSAEPCAPPDAASGGDAMVEEDDDARAQMERRALIRAAIARGPVVLRVHPHCHTPGYAVYVECGEDRVYACTLTTEPLPAGFVDADIVVMDATAPDPERTVREWLAREFSDVSLENVRVERYIAPKGTL